ncbi:MAG: NAD(P)H-hydrate dehydratase [Deltaproteobacteria bacterium]|nr:NAD(P)H-hydrate dehydratase [Deltaproteobacteria bacterium]
MNSYKIDNSSKWNDRLFMSREQIRTYDKIASEKYHIDSLVLMENAGRGASEIIIKLFNGVTDKNKKAAVIAGPGNNGGDGFVITRHLINAGIPVMLFMAVAESSLKGDALKNFIVLKDMKVPITYIDTEAKTENTDSGLKEYSIVIDALLGTGVERTIEGHLLHVLKLINESSSKIVSIDIPSGLDADTGIDWGNGVTADYTITFGHIKKGMLTSQNAFKTGKVFILPIGVPASASVDAGYEGVILDEQSVKKLLPKSSPMAHKGIMGHLAVVAGSYGKSGAAILTSKAALRSGTGLVTIATTAAAQESIEARSIEVMVTNMIEKADAPITDKIIKKIPSLFEDKTAVALGPGLTTAPGISMLAMKILQSINVPAVVDADGLNILAQDPSAAGRITTPMIFTPHPGEMARLLNISTAQVQADRIGSAKKAASWHKSIVVLKGSNTIIATPDGDVFVNPTGNCGMATAGTGDTLTGIIGGFLAQKIQPLEAAILGTFIHGKAGDQAVEKTGFAGLTASDIIKELPLILKEWEI